MGQGNYYCSMCRLRLQVRRFAAASSTVASRGRRGGQPRPACAAAARLYTYGESTCVVQGSRLAQSRQRSQCPFGREARRSETPRPRRRSNAPFLGRPGRSSRSGFARWASRHRPSGPRKESPVDHPPTSRTFQEGSPRHAPACGHGVTSRTTGLAARATAG